MMEKRDVYAEMLADTDARIERLEAELKKVRVVREYVENQLAGVPPASGANSEHDKNTQKPFAEMQSVDAAVAWLDSVGPPFRTTAEITAAMLRGGYETDAKRPTATIFSSLHRDYKREGTRLAKDEDSKWGLKKWSEKSEDSP